MNLFVILFSICLVKCLAMSQSELEDFSNFLEITSRLDIHVKSKAPEDEYDEDTPISDNAWEESGKFEGDLILNERQRRLLIADVAEGLSRNGLQDSTKRWPNNEVIYYIQREHFSSGQMQAIQAGIEDLAQVSCVKFTPYRKGDRDAVVIQGSRRGCFSQVGFQGGYQVLNLSGRHPVGRGCFRHGTIVHELLHSLGFYHMQSSPDRDDYIDVVWQNIIKPARHNFRKYNSFAVNDFGVGYDYESVLHYSRKAFSSNGQDTLVPKQPGADIGQRVGLSQKDIQKLNKMYCDIDFDDSNNADSDSTPKKPVTTKAKPKNKPFGGHGIGYHQGKAVAIKIGPTVELLRLPTLPKLHAFDYFSNAQQVLSPTFTETSEGERKIIYVTTKSANMDNNQKPTNGGLLHVTNNALKYNKGLLSNDDKELDNRNHNNVLATDQNSSHGLSDDVNEDPEEIGVALDEITNSEKIQYNPANAYSIKDSSKYDSLPIQVYDYTKDESEILSPGFMRYSSIPFGKEAGAKKDNLFPPHVDTTLTDHQSRTYPSNKFGYDSYRSAIPEPNSFYKHYVAGKSNIRHPTVEDSTSLSQDLSVYGGRSNKYTYGHYPYW